MATKGKRRVPIGFKIIQHCNGYITEDVLNFTLNRCILSYIVLVGL